MTVPPLRVEGDSGHVADHAAIRGELIAAEAVEAEVVEGRNGQSTLLAAIQTAAASGGLTTEEILDFLSTALVAGSNMTLTYNDAANTLTFASSGGGSLTIEDENGNIGSAVSKLDFQGAGVTATAGSAGEVIVTIPGGGSGVTIQDDDAQEGTNISTLDFQGDGVSVAVTGSEAVISIPGGGSSSGVLLTSNADASGGSDNDWHVKYGTGAGSGLLSRKESGVWTKYGYAGGLVGLKNNTQLSTSAWAFNNASSHISAVFANQTAASLFPTALSGLTYVAEGNITFASTGAYGRHSIFGPRCVLWTFTVGTRPSSGKMGFGIGRSSNASLCPMVYVSSTGVMTVEAYSVVQKTLTGTAAAGWEISVSLDSDGRFSVTVTDDTGLFKDFYTIQTWGFSAANSPTAVLHALSSANSNSGTAQPSGFSIGL